MAWFGPDRRQSDKKTEENKEAAPPAEDRRKAQRRQFFRLAYPPQAAPQIVNVPAQVVDISVKSVRFLPEPDAKLPANMKEGSRLNMSLKFQDGNTIEVSGTLLRQSTSTDGRIFYIYIFNREISATILNKEQAFLLKNFPEFCREKFRK